MLRYFKYRTPFKHVFKTAIRDFIYREGIFLVYEEGDFSAFGEVAPLPGFSNENFAQVEQVLIQNKEFLSKAYKENDADQIIKLLDQIHNFPSLSFGLDSLNVDLKAKRENQSLSLFLFGKEAYSPFCNTTIGMQSKEKIIPTIRTKVSEGFNTIKIKVGVAFESEKTILQTIRAEFPKIKIRVDANQAWDVNEAIENLTSIANLGIEYCEQPVAAEDINALKKVTENTEIKIAADESLGNKNRTKQLIEQNCCDLIILKPALIGLFDNINVTKQLAETHNMEVVFTTLMDGIIGRKITAVLASNLGSSTYAHGLATGTLLNEKKTETELIKKGKYIFQKTSGIGNPINLTLLEEII
tara:strand:- start:6623 stop:7693 length:1071 start_codon:yes stop_codon:yes gene_type:complete